MTEATTTTASTTDADASKRQKERFDKLVPTYSSLASPADMPTLVPSPPSTEWQYSGR